MTADEPLEDPSATVSSPWSRMTAGVSRVDQATSASAALVSRWINRAALALLVTGAVFTVAVAVIVARWLPDALFVPLVVLALVEGLTPFVLVRLALRTLRGLLDALEVSVLADVLRERSLRRFVTLANTLRGVAGVGLAPQQFAVAGLTGTLLALITPPAVLVALVALVV